MRLLIYGCKVFSKYFQKLYKIVIFSFEELYLSDKPATRQVTGERPLPGGKRTTVTKSKIIRLLGI